MPLTPLTALLFEQQYVSEQWQVLGSRLQQRAPAVSKDRDCKAHRGATNLIITTNIH
jgi:hypothetical protein